MRRRRESREASRKDFFTTEEAAKAQQIVKDAAVDEIAIEKVGAVSESEMKTEKATLGDPIL